MGLFSEPDRGSGSIANTIAKITDGFSKLVTQHLALARLEIAEDAKAVGTDLGRMAVFVPFLIVGYACLCGALAMVLGLWITQPGGFAVVGVANLAGGALGIRSALLRLQKRDVMSGTLQEFNRSAAVLSQDAALVTEKRNG